MSPGVHCELRVDLRWGSNADGGHGIAITVTGGRRTFTTTTRPPGRHLVGRILAGAGTASPFPLDSPFIGEMNQALLPPEMLEFLASERRDASRPLRLRLAIPDDEQHRPLRGIPWEMCTPGGWRNPGFTGMPTELSRHSDLHLVRETGTGGGGRYQQELQGRVVIASAYDVGGIIDGYSFEPLNPGHYSDANAVEDELRRTALSPDRIKPGWPRQGICADELSRALAADGAEAFYFAGHHGPGGLVVAGSGPGGDRSPAWLSAPDLATQLASAGVTVAVLMACQTAVALADDTARDDRAQSQRARLAFAEELTAAGVPWVVSAQRDISNHDSRWFAPIFFRWLAYGATVDEAAQMGCREMGDRSGLIAVHTTRDSADPVARRPPDLGRHDLAYRVAARQDEPSSKSAGLRRDARHRVNLDVLWGLNRKPFRAVLVAAEGALVLEARLSEVERIVQQGVIDSHRPVALQRRGWFAIQASDYPVSRAAELRVADRASWQPCLEAAPGGAAVGLVLNWTPHTDGDAERVREHIAALSSVLPGAAVIIRIGGLPGDDMRPADELSRILPGPLDILATLDSAAPDANARLDALIASGQPLASAGGHGAADAMALAALRHRKHLGWRNVSKIVNSGASEPIRAVAAYLAPAAAPERTPLDFLCMSEPTVVAAAWQAGLRPDLVPAALPSGAALMPGSWALLARSRLTPEIVCWLCERGSPLAAIPGLLPSPAPDQGHQAWLPALKAAYRAGPLPG